MPRVSLLVIVICSIFAAAGTCGAQQIHLPPAVSQSQGMGSPPVTPSDNIQRQQAMAANAQRQTEIKRDTQKMADLMQELKDYVAKSDQGVTSLEAIKKVEQIEKLAHSLKGKMKQSF